MQELLESLAECGKAQEALSKCYADCEYDTGYFCYNDQQRLDEAQKKLGVSLNRLIDKRIRKALDHYERTAD